MFLFKVLTASIGISVCVFSVAGENWAISLLVPMMHWTFIAAATLIAQRLRAFHSKKKQGSLAFILSSEHEHVLIVGTTGLARNYIQWIEDAASEYITLAGVLDESLPLKKVFLSSKVIGQPVDLANILNSLKRRGIKINRLVIADKFEELSDKTQGVLAYYESKGALTIDRMGDRLAGGDSFPPISPIFSSGPEVKLKQTSSGKVYHFRKAQKNSFVGECSKKHSMDNTFFRLQNI